MDTQPFNTVGELTAYLSGFAPNIPIVAHYTGEGRVSAVASHDDVGPNPLCVAIFRTSDAWLESRGLTPHNPILESGVRPVLVDPANPPSTDPNVLYGDRYGVDWVYDVVPGAI